MSTHSSPKSVAALVAGAVAIGFAPIFVRLSEVGPTATAFWRVALALPVLSLWAALTTREPSARPARGGGGGGALWLAGFCFAGDLAVWHWSIHFTSVANATLEANLASIFVTLLAWLILGQTVKRQFVAALVVSLLGTALIVGKNVHVTAQTLRGDALGVATALFYSGYILAVKAARDHGLPTARIMTISAAITAVVLLPVALLMGEPLLPKTARGWAVLIGLAMVAHVGGQSLIAYAMAELPASFASLGLLVQPATAAIAAWLLLGETLAPWQFVGGALLLAGIWWARRDSSRHAPS